MSIASELYRCGYVDAATGRPFDRSCGDSAAYREGFNDGTEDNAEEGWGDQLTAAQAAAIVGR